MYEIFEKLLKENNVKPADVARGTGMSSVVFTDWKNGKSKPNADKLLKIAKYFHTTVDYLLTGEKTESTFNAENAELLVKIHADNELLAALEKYFELPDDRKKLIVDNINMLSGVEK